MDHWGTFALLFTLLVIAAALVFLYLKLREKMIQRLYFSRSFSDIGTYENDKVTLTETIFNPTFVPLFHINVEGYIFNGIQLDEYIPDPKKGMQYYVSHFKCILPFQQIKRRHTITCKKRGFYQLEMVDIYYNRKVRYLDAPAQIYVYPKIISLYDSPTPTSIRQGDSFTRRPLIKDPFTFSGIRGYMFGDPFNSINFKATAKSGMMNLSAFKVNNRENCSNRTFMVYLNFQVDSEETLPTPAYEKMMELGLSFSAAVIFEAAYNGYRAGFAANPVTVDGKDQIRYPIQSGIAHLEDILKSMARARLQNGISFFSMLEADVKEGLTDAEVYIITPFVCEELDNQIAQMKLNDNNVTVFKLNDEEKRRREEEEIEANRQALKEAKERKAAEYEEMQAALRKAKRRGIFGKKKRKQLERQSHAKRDINDLSAIHGSHRPGSDDSIPLPSARQVARPGQQQKRGSSHARRR